MPENEEVLTEPLVDELATLMEMIEQADLPGSYELGIAIVLFIQLNIQLN